MFYHHRQVKAFSFSVILEVALGFDEGIWADEAAVERISHLWKVANGALFAPPINLPGLGTTQWARGGREGGVVVISVGGEKANVVSKDSATRL